MHTQERWFADGATVRDENRLPVAHVVGQEEDNSDALLIAQAPRMLAVMLDALTYLSACAEEVAADGGSDDSKLLVAEIREILAEAEVSP